MRSQDWKKSSFTDQKKKVMRSQDCTKSSVIDQKKTKEFLVKGRPTGKEKKFSYAWARTCDLPIQNPTLYPWAKGELTKAFNYINIF